MDFVPEELWQDILFWEKSDKELLEKLQSIEESMQEISLEVNNGSETSH